MVKLPKTVKKLCKHCKKHTEHKVSQAKRRGPNTATPGGKGAKWRTNFNKGMGNLGRYGSKPAIKDFKMTGKKTSKKLDLRYTCSVCKKTSVPRNAYRAKKLELK